MTIGKHSSMEAMLKWRNPTDFNHPFRGRAMVYHLSGRDLKWRIVPEDWLGLVDRHDRGFVAEDDPEWVQHSSDYPGYVAAERFRLAELRAAWIDSLKECR